MRKFVSLLLVASSLSASLASAQSAPPDELRIAEAKRRMVEGKKLHAQRQFEAAYVKFVEACAVIHSDRCLTGLAITELGSGRDVDAYDHFRGLLEPAPKAAIPAADVPDLVKAMGEAYSHTGHLKISAPEHATILVDGQEVGHAPLLETVTAKVGAHSIEAKDGAQTLTASVTAVAGQVQEVILTAPATPVVTPPVIAGPPAEQAPPMRPVEVERKSSWVSSPAVPIILGVAAVGLAIGGTVMLSNANSADSEASSLRGQGSAPGWSCAARTTPQASCDRLASLGNTSSTDRGLEVGLYAGASLAALGAIVWIVWKREAAPTTAIVPLVSPHLAGASISTSF